LAALDGKGFKAGWRNSNWFAGQPAIFIVAAIKQNILRNQASQLFQMIVNRHFLDMITK